MLKDLLEKADNLFRRMARTSLEAFSGRGKTSILEQQLSDVVEELKLAVAAGEGNSGEIRMARELIDKGARTMREMDRKRKRLAIPGQEHRAGIWGPTK